MIKQYSVFLFGGMIGLLTAASAEAQLVDNINGLLARPNVQRTDPGNTLAIDVSGFPDLATIQESPFSNNGNPTQFNRHDLLFSADGGVTARAVSNQEAFDISVDVTLDAGFDTGRKEAGLRINFFGFDGQFIVNTDANEIVAFGGTIPFYSFTNPVIPINPDTPPGGGLPGYVTGETINMRMIYTPPVYQEPTPPPGGPGSPVVLVTGKMQYIVDRGDGPVNSPVIEFGGSESGLIYQQAGSQIGVYVQATGVLPVQPDFVNATFANFDFDGPDAVDNADFDGDGDVDGRDFLSWQRGFGTTGAELEDGDADGNGTVDGEDLEIWQGQYGQGALTAFAAVPEPGSACLLLAGVGFVGLRPFRKKGCLLLNR